MVYFIMMVFCMFSMALRDFKFSKLSTMFWPFWIPQDHGINALILLVATTLEICEEIC
jgi:hypothetical protein